MSRIQIIPSIRILLRLMLPLLVLLSWAFSTEVSETQAEYPCPWGALHYDLAAGVGNNNQTQCEEIWSIRTTTIAVHSAREVDCHEPCVMVQSGNIHLRTCVNVTLTIQCHFEYLEERRIHFTGRALQSPVTSHMTTNAPRQQGERDRNHGFGVAAAVVLLGVAVLGLVWKAFNSRRSSPAVE